METNLNLTSTISGERICNEEASGAGKDGGGRNGADGYSVSVSLANYFMEGGGLAATFYSRKKIYKGPAPGLPEKEVFMTEIMRKESNQNIAEGRNYVDILPEFQIAIDHGWSSIKTRASFLRMGLRNYRPCHCKGVKRTHGSESCKVKSCGGCSSYPLWQGKEGI